MEFWIRRLRPPPSICSRASELGAKATAESVERPSRFRRVGSCRLSAKLRNESHQEDAVEFDKFARCFPTT
jgi:hypothetical protein